MCFPLDRYARRFTCLLLAGLLCGGWRIAVAVRSARAQSSAAPQKQTIRVAMRDGVKLATDVYLPEGTGPFPVILSRTPYNKDGMAGFAADGARRGYAMAMQDTRGRFGSEGENLPFEGDGWAPHSDGYDTLEWMAKQPWCNGKIGTFGGSALGITQILAAASGTKRITAQAIQVAAPSFYHYIYFTGGVFRKAMVEDWVRGTNHDPRFIQLAAQHGTFDDFWRARDAALRFDKIDAPAVHIGGWYDIFTQGMIDTFNGYQTKGGPHARGKQKLVMGPWTHGILQERAGELTFPNGRVPPGPIVDAWAWFEHYLKGVDNGIDRLPAVTYYVMGDTTDSSAPGKVWRTAETWPPPGSTATPYYLHADRTLGTAKQSGADSVGYAYDPKNPSPTVGGPMLTLPGGAMNQKAFESAPGVVTFTSEPLAEPLEVTGRVRMELWASSDAPDTDFFAKLCDVYPDGRSINVCEGILRARFREGFTRERMMKPGVPYRFDIDLQSTSMVFNKGHRLRVDISSSSAPGYDPNPNTGEPFRASTNTRVAHNTILCDSSHASRIVLPVMGSAATTSRTAR